MGNVNMYVNVLKTLREIENYLQDLLTGAYTKH